MPSHMTYTFQPAMRLTASAVCTPACFSSDEASSECAVCERRRSASTGAAACCCSFTASDMAEGAMGWGEEVV